MGDADADSAAVSATADANAEATILPSMISFAVPLLRLLKYLLLGQLAEIRDLTLLYFPWGTFYFYRPTY